MDILETALLEMCRKRKKMFFYPEDIIREMYPIDWKHFLPDLEILIGSLLEKGKIEMEETPFENLSSNKGNERFKIRCLAKPKS